MAQMIIRNLDDDVKARLKKHAARHGRSMEEEARQILWSALKETDYPSTRLGSRISARFAGIGLDSDIPELHGQTIVPMNLGK